MIGMAATNGRKVSNLAHLKQSISDILGTPIGTRLMRRDYGAETFDYIDAPGNPFNAQRIIAASAAALIKWEPRIKVDRVQSSVNMDGRAEVLVEGETTDGIKFSDVFVLGGAV